MFNNQQFPCELMTCAVRSLLNLFTVILMIVVDQIYRLELLLVEDNET